MVNRYMFPDHRIRLDYLVDAIKRVNPRSLIDFGCGDTPIQNLDFNLYVGVDESDQGIDRNKFKHPNYHFLETDYTKPILWIVDYTFDAAVWSEGPEHTLNHDAVFNNIKRVLKPCGVLFITCPNEGKWSVHPESHDHKCSFGLESLEKLVGENGFTVLEATKIYCRIPPEQIGYHWLFILASKSQLDPRIIMSHV